MSVRAATTGDLDALAELAALTFPLAAPDDAAPESLAAFIAEHLSRDRFAEYLEDPSRDVLVSGDGVLDGYLMLIDREPTDPDVSAVVTTRPTVELSKFYVAPAGHGRGLAGRLMAAAIDAASRRGAASVWLGVNQENERAQHFYAKHGFVRVGTKRFQVGARLEHDYVLESPVTAQQ